MKNKNAVKLGRLGGLVKNERKRLATALNLEKARQAKKAKKKRQNEKLSDLSGGLLGIGNAGNQKA